MANSLKFGTSGLRGLAVELIGVESRRYAAAFVSHLRQSGPVTQMLVGRDLRQSSPAISDSVVAALNGLGVEAVDLALEEVSPFRRDDDRRPARACRAQLGRVFGQRQDTVPLTNAD